MSDRPFSGIAVSSDLWELEGPEHSEHIEKSLKL
jgi:hypothetical protein